MTDEAKPPKYPILDEIEVPLNVLENWQITADLLAEIAEIPAALIMRVHAREIEVLVASQSPDNVYHAGEKAPLDSGLYCETVMNTRNKLLVPNALKDPLWDKNPNIALGMISYCGLPITWPGGEIFGTICILDKQENSFNQRMIHLMERFRDIIQLSLSETLYRALVETTGTGYVIVDAEGRVVDANAEYVRLSGHRDLHEIRGRSVLEWTADYEKNKNAEAVARCAADGYIRNLEIDYTDQHGTITSVEINASVVNMSGTPQILTLCRDISERKKAEKRIKAERKKLKDILDNMIDGVTIIDLNGKITAINKESERQHGFTEEEVIGKTPGEIFLPEEEMPKFLETLEDLNSGKIIINKEFVGRHKDGRTFPVSVNCSFIKDTKGHPTAIINVHRDISKQKQAEEEKRALQQQLQQAQRLESLGVLAGGIAHDFNNILAVIICNCSLAKERPKLTKVLIPEIEQAAERAAELCRQMLAYAGKTQFVQSHVNLLSLVNEMLVLLEASLPPNVLIITTLSADSPFIDCDAGQIRQLVMNLMINASEAIGESQGSIMISLANAELKPEQTERDHLGKIIPPGLYLRLEVTDSGCGMDDETKRRICEPFFTTKFAGRGLGMSAALGIITSHKGALQISSKPGEGSTFRIYLPAEAKALSKETPRHISSTPWQGSGTILLVDDEPQLMQVAKLLLKALGFDVFEAANGREALELYRKNADYITMVVTDLGMPVMDGYELIRELKKLNPELPVIVSSGYGDVDVTSRIAAGDIAGFLGKPYIFDKMREVLKRVVDDHAAKHSEEG